jgi:endonuclease/exonuclease/phosphatase family metal-dependent hydrolase
MPTVRLLTYNVRSLRDDASAVVRIVRAARPDVVCIQEAPRFALWRLRGAVFARRCRLRWVAGGRRAGANLLLCRPGVRRLARHDLALSRDPGLHARGAAVAELAVDGCAFVVAGVHLDLTPGPRLRHVRELRVALAGIRSEGAAVVVAGDVNEPAPGPTWSALEVIGVDAGSGSRSGAPTFPAAGPAERIDGVFASPPATICSVDVIDTPAARLASDHLPVLVVLDLPFAHPRVNHAHPRVICSDPRVVRGDPRVVRGDRPLPRAGRWRRALTPPAGPSSR